MQASTGPSRVKNSFLLIGVHLFLSEQHYRHHYYMTSTNFEPVGCPKPPISGHPTSLHSWTPTNFESVGCLIQSRYCRFCWVSKSCHLMDVQKILMSENFRCSENERKFAIRSVKALVIIYLCVMIPVWLNQCIGTTTKQRV